MAHSATLECFGYFLVELVHLLSDLLFLRGLDLRNYLEASALEGY